MAKPKENKFYHLVTITRDIKATAKVATHETFGTVNAIPTTTEWNNFIDVKLGLANNKHWVVNNIVTLEVK